MIIGSYFSPYIVVKRHVSKPKLDEVKPNNRWQFGIELATPVSLDGIAPVFQIRCLKLTSLPGHEKAFTKDNYKGFWLKWDLPWPRFHALQIVRYRITIFGKTFSIPNYFSRKLCKK